MENNFKIIDDDGRTLLKVIDFPAEGFAGESMWVEFIHGNDYEGVGLLSNHPAFSELKYGDVVKYSDGTDEIKPSYSGLYFDDVDSTKARTPEQVEIDQVIAKVLKKHADAKEAAKEN
jgi:hypothetical protein